MKMRLIEFCFRVKRLKITMTNCLTAYALSIGCFFIRNNIYVALNHHMSFILCVLYNSYYDALNNLGGIYYATCIRF
jgi:hypothetical protein